MHRAFKIKCPITNCIGLSNSLKTTAFKFCGNRAFSGTSKWTFSANVVSPCLQQLRTGQSTQIQLWRQCIQRIKSANISKQLPKRPRAEILLLCSGASLCLTFATLGKGSLVRHAQCEYKAQKSVKSRLAGMDSEDSQQEPQFPWKDFLKLLIPEIWYLLGAVVSALAVAIVNIQIPILLGDVVNVVSRYTAESAGNFMDEIRQPVMKLVSMYGIQGFLTFVYITLLSSVGERVATRMRKQLFENIINQDIAFFDSHKTGEIVNRLTSDVQDFKSSFKLCISQGLRSFTQVIGCAVSLYVVSPKLTSLLIVVVPTIIGAGTLIGSLLRKLSRQAQAQISKATAVADEAIGNVRTVRAFAMEPKEVQLYNEEVEESSRLNQLLGIGIGLFQGISNTVLNGIVLGTLYAGGYLMSKNELTAGNLMSFMVATQTVQRSLAQMSLLFGQTVRGISAGARVFEYSNIEASMTTKGGTIIPYHALKGEVTFKDVSFTYPTRPKQTVLQDFNLTIPAGRMVAICGLSGGGKSTVAALLERFYDVDTGSIAIDGHNLCTLDPSWLRGRAIGFINQEPVLFATSVLENIRYGRPDATDQEVMDAAKLANAHNFISGFPEGYGTVLGERGVTVSGGQKQRIAIARALIKNPSILILDEATSALDAESERIVQEALDRVVKGRTVLVIAHRLSTIRDADLIAVVNKGVIAEMGKHDDLKKKRGLYHELIKKQESEEGGEKRTSWFG